MNDEGRRMTESNNGRRAAIVTGGSRGIGRAIAVALAREGFDVVVNFAKNLEAAESVKGEIEGLGARVLLVQADVSIGADRQRIVEQTLAAFGRIDLLVNNAGIAPDVRADILEASEESFDRLIDVNLKGPYFLTQLVAREMVRRESDEATKRRSDEGGAKIINITSVSAYAAS